MAATSARSAWAVGDYIAGISVKTLILRWNGTAWKRVPSPSPAPSKGLADLLNGVAATSAGNAWAVGDISCGCGPGPSLILRWNGTTWKRVPSPPAGGAALRGVAATSARSAWAVGDTMTGDTSFKTVILRWNGKAWKQVPSPAPGGSSSSLSGVATTSATNAWAVGGTFNSTVSGSGKALILRWNGKTWK